MEKSKGTQQRAQWASSLGFILATAGSAVGLGNIWKFPGKAYEGGGAAFIIVYILSVAFLGMSIMLAEFAVGRRGQKNPAAAFQKIGHGRGGWIGKLSLITAFIILSYYSQVGGWVLKYIEGYLMESGTLYADPTGYFLGMLGSSGMPWQSAVIYPAIFLAMVVFTIIRGVEEGIERMSKILMPGLFLLLIVLTVRAVTLPGAAEGLSYLLRPDWSKLSFQMVLVALGQAFYSLSLGMAIITTYGSYVSRQENLVKHTAIICSLDTVVAIMAAFMVIPAVFAMGVQPGMGGSFAFISLAEVFRQMPMGNLFGAAFYLLLFLAALTSAISLLEGPVAYFVETFDCDRKKVTYCFGIALFVLGIFYTLSQVYLPLKGVWFDGANGLIFPPFGDFMEFLTDRLMVPVGALALCLFVGWRWGASEASREIEHNGRFPLRAIWIAMVKFIAPLSIVVILIGGLVFGLALS